MISFSVTFRTSGLPATLILLAAVLLCSRATGDEKGQEADEAGRAVRLENMKRAAKEYAVYAGADRNRPLAFVEKPVLRWTNPEDAAKDGTIFLWTLRGRPQAVLGLFTYDDDHFSHEWQSLAEEPLRAERGRELIWNPRDEGLRFRILEDAPEPSPSAASRLRQMKSLAGKFSSTFAGFKKDRAPVELRLLPQPLYRYEIADDSDLADGALFAFVQGTDPQTLLLLEAKKNGEGSRWQYAFARMSSGEVLGRYEGREVFSAATYDFNADPQQPFLLLQRQPAPGK
ncbi:MAG TPA: hypothetical protein VKU82_05550 [Planctomycetaceae bacterium]|nr:hypothetical protein [Planctomycetaceae bacterium]